MYYRIQKADHWEVNTSIVRQGECIGGDEVLKRYLPQYARTEGGPWHTFADLGFQRDGFETPSAAEAFIVSKNPHYQETFQGVSSADEPLPLSIRLTPAQERLLRQLLLDDEDPMLRLYSDVLRDGEGRNPTFRALRKLGLVAYTHVAGNSFRARLTVRGIHYLHGE